MFLKNDRIVVRVGGITFRSFKMNDGSGEFILDPTAIVGWTDGPSVRRSAVDRPTSDGTFTEPYHRGARTISISGTAVATNRVQLQQMRDQLMGLLWDGSYVQISVETSVDTRYSTVGLEGTPSWVQHTDTFAAFKIDFYAPDPYIYGVERRTTISGTTGVVDGLKYPLTYPVNYNLSTTVSDAYIKNNGNAMMWPKFTIHGDYYAGFFLTDNISHRVTFTGPVSSFSPVTIDMGAGTAFQNGIDKSEYLSKRGWWGVPPGQTIRPRFEPIQQASGWCDIIFRDTWI